MSAKEVAQRLAATAVECTVRFPKIWNESQILQACGTHLMLHRISGGFAEKDALDDLIDKYGVDDEAAANKVNAKPASDSKDAASKSSPTKKRKSNSGIKDEDGGAASSSPIVKKVKKTELVTVEENRPAAEAIKEMADIYFKHKDMRKGGVFSKAAKGIREADFIITDKKSAMKLPGVGKGIAGYIEEMLETGSIKTLEELRAGTA